MFPLSILPMPGELIPLHIFEPRYRQLLEDAETKGISFGIFFNHSMNKEKVGSLVKLESIIKRYKTGESDIIVKCIGLFSLDSLNKNYRDKLYPGGNVSMWNVDLKKNANYHLIEEYLGYLELQRLNISTKEFSIFDIANELNFDFEDRLKFIFFDEGKKESFLLARLKYQKHLLMEAVKAKDVYHLN
jgi:hypothetical protein